MKKLISAFVCFILLLSCKYGITEHVFILSDRVIIEQGSVNNMGRKYFISFSQYEGFTINLDDSLSKIIHLSIEDQKVIENDILDSITINRLKKNLVNNIILHYNLKPNDSVSRIKEIIKSRFRQLTIKEDYSTYDFVVIDSRKQLVCSVKYSDFGVRNYILIYYPVLPRYQ